MLIPQKKPVPSLSSEAFTGDFINVKVDEEKERIKKLISSSLIDLSEKLEPPPVAMYINAEEDQMILFTKGNFSIITGTAKSKKSYLISQLMAAAIKGNFQDKLFSNGTGMNILFDTEQSRYKVQQISKRICQLSGNSNPSNLMVYSLRTKDPLERLEIIDWVLATTPNINFVAIDGIIDLGVDPILQAQEAQQIITKLLQWTELYNIHIACVLHYNKTVATLLGHLGSSAHRKADAVIEVSKCKDDANISVVTAIDCREKDFPPFAFCVDPGGMPYILKDYVIEKKTKLGKEAKEKKPAFSFSHLESGVHDEILKSVFKIHREQGYNDCWRNIKSAVENIAGETIGDNRAKDFLTAYLSKQEIIKLEQPKKKPVYVLPGQKDIDFE